MVFSFNFINRAAVFWATILVMFFSSFAMCFVRTTATTTTTQTEDNTNSHNHTSGRHHDRILRRWGGWQYCGASTFINQVSDGSPWIQDCQHLMKQIEDHNDWGWGGNCNQRMVASYQTCKIGINLINEPCGDFHDLFKFGNGDGVYVINESILRFGDERIDRVGTKGFMDCWATNLNGELEDRTVTINWGIY